MRAKKIYITEFDKNRLLELIKLVKQNGEQNKCSLRELEQELQRAKVVKPEKIPANVITMNSRVKIKNIDNDKESVYQVVFPNDVDIEDGKISVLAPIGTALLGYKVGDTITWKVPSGDKSFFVEQMLYQPEASGVYDE